jgi:hypothetical protein
MRNRYILLHLCLLSPILFKKSGFAQSNEPVIKITYPESRAIFQRENDNTSTIYLSAGR